MIQAVKIEMREPAQIAQGEEEKPEKKGGMALSFELDTNFEFVSRKATVSKLVSIPSISSILMAFDDGKIV